jgi:hypothetical protein
LPRQKNIGALRRIGEGNVIRQSLGTKPNRADSAKARETLDQVRAFTATTGK